MTHHQRAFERIVQNDLLRVIAPWEFSTAKTAQLAADKCRASLGPRIDRIHRVGQSDHRLLFFNWY